MKHDLLHLADNRSHYLNNY